MQPSRRPEMAGRTSSGRPRYPPAKAAAAVSSNSPVSGDDASASRPGTSPPASPKPATKHARKKAPPKRRFKKETESESEFDDPDVVVEDDLSGFEDNVPTSKSKNRGPIPSAKGRGGTGKRKVVLITRDESSSGKKASTSAMPPAKRLHAEDDISSPGEQAASTEPPPPKRSKLPPIPKKSNIATNGTASVGSNTPTSKPNASATAVLPAGVRRPPPVPGAKKGGDIDLNNLDEYNKLFGIAGGSSTPKANKPPATSTPTTNFRLAEQKAKEIAAKREQARAQRIRDWDPANCFDLQASGDRIRAYEQKLWNENRYMYISQVASAWIVMASPPPGTRPHRLDLPDRLPGPATPMPKEDHMDLEP